MWLWKKHCTWLISQISHSSKTTNHMSEHWFQLGKNDWEKTKQKQKHRGCFCGWFHMHLRISLGTTTLIPRHHKPAAIASKSFSLISDIIVGQAAPSLVCPSEHRRGEVVLHWWAKGKTVNPTKVLVWGKRSLRFPSLEHVNLRTVGSQDWYASLSNRSVSSTT